MSHPTPPTSSGRSYTERDLKLLWGRAAARCAFPDCRLDLLVAATSADRAAVVGHIAHIVAHGTGASAPRLNATFDDDLRDKYENLLLLCPTHHTLVDKQPNTYTVADLRAWKEGHERWVFARLREAVPRVGFAELEVVAKALVHGGVTGSMDFDPTIVKPEEKMRRNGLSDAVHFELTLGLSKAREVEHFVAHVGMVNTDFGEQLRAGFVEEYKRQRAAGVDGDALFQALATFAANGHPEFRFVAAGLVVLAYLFEKCEVFER